MSILLLLVAFLAGVLTVLAPCVLPVLPIIIGTTATSGDRSRVWIVPLSLAGSVILFTLLLKASAVLIDIPQSVWTGVSGGIILFFGVTLLFPHLWERISFALGFSGSSQQLLSKAGDEKSVLGGVLVGAALGPVFASCSPTYFVILATVLPSSFWAGVLYLISYGLGLALILMLIGYFGQKLVAKLRWLANPEGWFKKIMGILLILVGVLIVTGYEKKIEQALLDAGFNASGIEENLLEKIDMGNESGREAVKKSISADSELPYLYKAPDIVGLTGWLNSEPIESLDDLKGKVVLVDFWTYSCINCIRTLPYLQSWQESYADDGLVILGVHAPEFQFEKVPANVEKAVRDYGLSYPIAQDNDFETWRAYKNRYWPAKYLIDKEGNVRYVHFGEGEYEETEKAIVDLLGAEFEGEKVEAESVDFSSIKTPETYVGLGRRKNYVKGAEKLEANQWTLVGEWDEEDERVVSRGEGAGIKMNFTAGKANLVIGGNGEARVLIDGKDGVSAGDVVDGVLKIDGNRLYRVADLAGDAGMHEIEIIFEGAGVELYAWTFG